MAGVGCGQWSGPQRLALVWKEEEKEVKMSGIESRFQVSGEARKMLL